YLSHCFFNATPPTASYTLSLHDALPILVEPLLARPCHLEGDVGAGLQPRQPVGEVVLPELLPEHVLPRLRVVSVVEHRDLAEARSEEHTSELQSRENLVCRLLLEKKNIT